jgi:hypothetical protein
MPQQPGIVTTKFIGRDMTTRKNFKTAFTREGPFRFEYSDLDGYATGKPYIVWTDGKSVRSWTHLNPGEEKHFLLSMALAGATGVSGGSAHTVPRLLLPMVVGGWALTEVWDPCCEGEETIDGRICLKVVTKYPSGSPLTIWLDKETHLVRRIFEAHDFKEKGFSTEQTTDYAPEVHVSINPAELAFNPPAEEAAAPK